MLTLKHKLLLLVACVVVGLTLSGGIVSADQSVNCPDGSISKQAADCDTSNILQPGCYVDSSNVRNDCDPKKVPGFNPNKCYRAADASKGLVKFAEVPCGGTTDQGGATVDCSKAPKDSTNCITQPDTGSIAACDAMGGASTGCGLFGYINDGIRLLSALIGIIATGMIIVGGIQYTAAGADPNAVAKAKKTIFNGIFMLIGYGLLFAVAQWLIPGGIL